MRQAWHQPAYSRSSLSTEWPCRGTPSARRPSANLQRSRSVSFVAQSARVGRGL